MPGDMRQLLECMRARSGDFIAIRRDLHRYPELGFQEHRTSDLVAEALSRWGYVVERNLGGTGLVGQLRKGSGNKTLGLRADMDALPIQEQTGLPHQSRNAGVMHACGHDGHVSMLLAAAHYLSQDGVFDGTLNLIFQPAEEGLGGARSMMEDGLFEKYPCDAIFAMHNMPGVPQGHLVFRDGPFMASSDYVTVTLEGRGGHGAMPHLAADPIVAGAAIVMALQAIVSRNIDPSQMAVITVGALNAGTANNVIPQSATLELSVRALDRTVRLTLEKRIREVVQTQAHSYGVESHVNYRSGYPVLVNSIDETSFAREVAQALLGPQRVTLNGQALTGSEDFAFMLERVPGSYLLIGNGDGDSANACMVHNPGFDFNDVNLAVGAAYWVALAEAWLQCGSST